MSPKTASAQGFVYALCTEDGTPMYVGATKSSVRVRFNKHKSTALTGSSNYPVHRWMRSVGVENVRIIALFASEDKEQLDAAEMFLIATLRAMGVNIKNVSDGGPGTRGVIPDEKTRAKMRESNVGKKRPPRTEQHRRRIAESKRGTTHSEETKRRISERTREGMAAAKARREAEAQAAAESQVLAAAAEIMDALDESVS